MESIELKPGWRICTCPPGSNVRCRCFDCKCDLSKPRDPAKMLPNAEDLQSRGICIWCGWPERCRCDLSKPRKEEDKRPNAEALQAIGICPWCGFPED